MVLTDTHCHIQSIGLQTGGEANTRALWSKEPDLTAQAVIAAAQELGVSRLICVGCDPFDSQLAVQFVQEQPATWASVGIHPHEAGKYTKDPAALEILSSLVKSPKVVAIGECGLDYYYHHSEPQDQIKLLRLQLELATQHKLPVIFHVREAFSGFWPIIDDYPELKGVLHSFTDNRVNLDQALKRNLYIGVNGIATFTKDADQLAVYKAIPLDNLLLETDAPFLTPTPYRGKLNQSKYVWDIAEFVARLRGLSLEEIASATTNNANQLFWPK